MDYSKVLNIDIGKAVCYSGYRKGQTPGEIFPTYNQVKEDLLIINKTWKYIRLYSCDFHSRTVLEVIKNEKLDLKVYARFLLPLPAGTIWSVLGESVLLMHQLK